MTIRRLLIANRGEIAVRIIRACREAGIESVAVYSDADATRRSCPRSGPRRPHRPGRSRRELPLDSGADRAPRAATSCDAVHPGYGFLSERAAFARACEEAGLVFVGPPADVIERMGSKIAARDADGARRRAGGPGRHTGGSDRTPASWRRRGPHRLPGAGQGVGRRRRQGHADRVRRPPTPESWCRRHGASRRRHSATARSTSSGSSSGRGTSRSRSSPTRTATSCISSSASARSSGVIRRSSRRARRRR